MKFRKDNSKSSEMNSHRNKVGMRTNTLEDKTTSDMKCYRVEGVGRNGVRYVKVIGHAGEWYICGVEGQKKEIIRPDAKTIKDAIRIGKRFLGFEPLCVREINE